MHRGGGVSAAVAVLAVAAMRAPAARRDQDTQRRAVQRREGNFS